MCSPSVDDTCTLSSWPYVLVSIKETLSLQCIRWVLMIWRNQKFEKWQRSQEKVHLWIWLRDHIGLWERLVFPRAPLDYVLAFWARLGRNFPFITPPEKRISLILVILEIQFTVKRHKLLHCQSKVRQEERARVLFRLLCSCRQNGLHQSITALLILCHQILTWLHP